MTSPEVRSWDPLFGWADRVLHAGTDRRITLEDLPRTPGATASIVGDQFLTCWCRCRPNARSHQTSGWAVLKALVSTFWKKHYHSQVLWVIAGSAQVFQALCLGWLVHYFNDANASPRTGVLYASLLVVSQLVLSLATHHSVYRAGLCFLHVQMAICSTVYDKLLRLHLGTLRQVGAGLAVNIMSTDMDCLQLAVLYMHTAWLIPVQTAAILYAGVHEVGWPFLLGIGLLIVILMREAVFGGVHSRLRLQKNSTADERVRRTSELLGSGCSLKMGGWHSVLSCHVKRLRQKEIKCVLNSLVLSSCSEGLSLTQLGLVSMVVFIAMAATGQDLMPSKVFTVLSLNFITQPYYYAIEVLCAGWASLCRVQQYLLLQEKQPTAQVCAESWAVRPLLPSKMPKDLPGPVQHPSRSVKKLAGCSSKSVSFRRASFTWEEVQQPSVNNPMIQKLTTTTSSMHIPKPPADSPRLLKGNSVLDCITLDVSPGELVVVVGPAGAAKTSLLLAILGELNPDMNAPEKWASLIPSGRMAYASQETWVQSQTLQNNILLGSPYDSNRYQQVVKACGLDVDLKALAEGDMTVLADRGSNLSGGQRARLELARMAYADADTYIMDDPLSAVDPGVAKQIYSELICGVLAHKTRILVTHQVQHLSGDQADQVVLMEHGRIVANGTFADLCAKGFMSAAEAAATPPAAHPKCLTAPRLWQVAATPPVAHPDSLVARAYWQGNHMKGMVPLLTPVGCHESFASRAYRDHRQAWQSSPLPSQRNLNLAPDRMGYIRSPCLSCTSVKSNPWGGRHASDVRALTDCSTRTAGEEEDPPPEAEMGWRLYWRYACVTFTPGSGLAAVLTLLWAQISVMLLYIMLAEWSSATPAEQRSGYWVTKFAILLPICTALGGMRMWQTMGQMARTASCLHDRMLDRVIGAPMAFFDNTPLGEMLNRFSLDLGLLDQSLPLRMYSVIVNLLMCVGTVALACTATPWVTPCLLPLLWWFVHLVRVFLRTSRPVVHLEASSRTPLYTLLSESVEGMASIRAFKKQAAFTETFCSGLDHLCRMQFARLFTLVWLGIRLDMIVSGLQAATALLSVLLTAYAPSAVNVNILAAALLYMSQISEYLQWAVIYGAEAEQNLVSLERVLAFCELEQEAVDVGKVTPPAAWPATGNIQISNLWLRYQPHLPPILKGLSVKIKHGTRVGVVGRTGAGKSSLIYALFRLVEADHSKGFLKIDGIDTRHVSLDILRTRLAAITQIPCLYEGTLRFNLDLYNKCSDIEVWETLDAVNLKTLVMSLPGHLEARLSVGGSNFSAGERQLLCLARVLLQKSRVLVMDEATANIDLATDKQIQEILSKRFQDCTVIMVAHRLQTIIDCDTVLVLSAGQLVQQGHPHTLLSEPGVFANMVAETGDDTAQHLAAVAKTAWDKSNNQHMFAAAN